MSEKFAGMLRDESRIQGHAEAVARPRDVDQLRQAAQEAAGQKIPITVQGAATGLEGGGVPRGGWLISTRGMNQILGLREDGGAYYLRVQAGVTFEQVEEYLRRQIESQAYFFPPNPTEKSATLGGAYASDAAGTLGRVRDYVNDILWVGNIVAELELALQAVPKCNWGVLLFFTSPGNAKAFARAVLPVGYAGCAHFDTAALGLLRSKHELPEDAREAIYLVLCGEDDAGLEETLAAILALYLEIGGREDYAWAAEGLAELEKFQAMCHAVPELINSELDKAGRIQPGLCKAAVDRMYVGLDMIP